MMNKTDDLRILELQEVLAPEVIHEQFPSTENAQKTISEARKEIHNILTGEDDRLIVVIGPCSIHDIKAAKEYAELIKTSREKLEKDLLIIMRVYFEKRQSVGKVLLMILTWMKVLKLIRGWALPVIYWFMSMIWGFQQEQNFLI